MRAALLALALLSAPAAAGGYVSAGHGFRAQSWHVTAGLTPLEFERSRVGIEVAAYSMGEQPDGFENINRMAEVSVIGFADLTDRIAMFAKFGANNTHWSHNGTNDYDRSDDDLWGWHGGIGIETPLAWNLSAYLQATTYQYRQVNNPNMGGYTYSGLGIRYTFD
ncbi:MAG: hypothetical protein MUF16_19910 [Burkholderiaceae bacterium]|jgi:hypothetical protein|nr:hypothetical protein [Burkholderiaceae bacterium]